jgi:hypothetical protein
MYSNFSRGSPGAMGAFYGTEKKAYSGTITYYISLSLYIYTRILGLNTSNDSAQSECKTSKQIYIYIYTATLGPREDSHWVRDLSPFGTRTCAHLHAVGPGVLEAGAGPSGSIGPGSGTWALGACGAKLDTLEALADFHEGGCVSH